MVQACSPVAAYLDKLLLRDEVAAVAALELLVLDFVVAGLFECRELQFHPLSPGRCRHIAMKAPGCQSPLNADASDGGSGRKNGHA